MSIRSIKPGKLRGYSPERIETALIQLMGYDCYYREPYLVIGPINDYENPKFLIKDVRAIEVGDPKIIGTKQGIFIEILLSQKAMDVIHNRDIKEEEQ